MPPAHAAPVATDWQTYVLGDGSCKVDLPARPRERTATQNTEVGPIRVFAFEARSGGAEYMVMYNDYDPQRVSLDKPEVLFDGALEGIAEGSAIIESRSVQIDGLPGKEFSGTMRRTATRPPGLLRGRFVLSGIRFYQVLAYMPGGAGLADGERVLKSFKVMRGH